MAEGKEISAEERAWLLDYLTYQAKEVINTDSKARAVAKDLVDSLGGSPPADNIQGWLESEADVIDKVASEVVEQAEQTVAVELPDQQADEDVEYDEDIDEEVDEAELDKLIALYDRLLDLVGRLGDGAELTADDMDTLLAAEEAEILTLSFDNDQVSFESSGDGGLTLESSVVER